jgi:hypothetical protein
VPRRFRDRALSPSAMMASRPRVPALLVWERKEQPEGENSVTSQWQYQVRFDVNDSATAELARRKLRDPALAPLFDVLAEHRAALKCQFDAFAEYVAAAEEHGVENYPLYQWTKATIENPAKKEKYLKSFTLYVDDREVYGKEIADALEADLQPLATSGLISRISKYDTNPANNPQSPQRPRERSDP